MENINFTKLLKKYGVGSHVSMSNAYIAICMKGFTKKFDECTPEEIAKEYSERRRIRARKVSENVQCEMFPTKEVKKFKKIGKYKADVSVLTFQPTKETKDSLLSNCAEFGINYGEVLNRILIESKWDKWNNRDWLNNFNKEN